MRETRVLSSILRLARSGHFSGRSEHCHTIGLDIAKNLCQAHGVDAEVEVVFRRRITREGPRFLFEPTEMPARHRSVRQLPSLGQRVRRVEAHRERCDEILACTDFARPGE